MYAKLVFYFLGILGDYDSMHMFAQESVRHPPSVKARSLILLLQFKDNHNQGKVLIDENGQPVTDVERSSQLEVENDHKVLNCF